jgi:hypothetical protein
MQDCLQEALSDRDQLRFHDNGQEQSHLRRLPESLGFETDREGEVMKAMYSALHKSWIVLNPERHELIIGSGATKGEAEAKATKHATRA